ncbi:unnamed protein product [Acanthoscelides obtectus]|nr:unnamed protein product [Acanthoscelides obtectus]CAK1659392.1 Pulmonary surfactant-associated protein D [Acanthoscelides obtectus]
MDLLSIETQEEHLFLQQSLLSYLDLNTAQQTFIWTSGKRVDGDRWIWEATGRPVHYKNWWAEQPDNDGGIENCLELWYKPEFPGQIKWNDIYCNNTSRYFICEYNNKDANIDNVY